MSNNDWLNPTSLCVSIGGAKIWNAHNPGSIAGSMAIDKRVRRQDGPKEIWPLYPGQHLNSDLSNQFLVWNSLLSEPSKQATLDQHLAAAPRGAKK